MFIKQSKSNYFLLQFQTKYLTNQQKRIPMETSLIPFASSTLPNTIKNCGWYSLILALFDKEKNKTKRWIEKPLQYTIDHTITKYLYDYYTLIFNSFDSFDAKKSLMKTLSYNIITSTSSVIIPSYELSSNKIIWGIVSKIGINTLVSIIHYFV